MPPKASALQLLEQGKVFAAEGLAYSHYMERGMQLEQERIEAKQSFESARNLTLNAESYDQRALEENAKQGRCWRQCHSCGANTLNQLRLQKAPDCPHIACSLACLHKLGDEWIDIKCELKKMERDLSELSENRSTPLVQATTPEDVAAMKGCRLEDAVAVANVGMQLQQEIDNVNQSFASPRSSRGCGSEG